MNQNNSKRTISATPVENNVPNENFSRLSDFLGTFFGLLMTGFMVIGVGILWYAQIFRAQLSFLSKNFLRKNINLPVWASILLIFFFFPLSVLIILLGFAFEYTK